MLRKSDSAILRSLDFLSPILRRFSVSKEECAEYMWSALYRIGEGENTGSAGVPGSYRIGRHGEDFGTSGYYGTKELRNTVWEKTLEVTGSKDE